MMRVSFFSDQTPHTWQENDAEMIVAKILAINKVAASRLALASKPSKKMLTQCRTQLSDFDRHTI